MIYLYYIYYDCTEFNVIWSTKEKVVSIVCVVIKRQCFHTSHISRRHDRRDASDPIGYCKNDLNRVGTVFAV